MKNARRTFAIAAAVACLALSVVPTTASAHGRHTIRRYALSHHHPKTGSLLCAAFAVNTGHVVTVRVVSGPAPVVGSPATGYARGDGTRSIVGVVSFDITTPGTYTVRTILKTRRGSVLRRATQSYEVPPPPPDGEPVGPFECPTRAEDSFPD
jgi:hypothetical protein